VNNMITPTLNSAILTDRFNPVQSGAPSAPAYLNL
jgi:hypothetical protein